MKRSILVWDLPTRLFHWALAACVVGAYAIGQLVDDDSPSFAVHMLFGATAAFLVAWRVVWGFVGTRWARFPSFVFGPAAIAGYFRGLFSAEAKRHVGHNPGSSVAIFAMLALTLGAASSGAAIGAFGEAAEEVHEVLANLLLLVSGAHVVGVLLHVVRRRENLVGSMITGRKEGDEADGIPSSRPLVGVGLLIAAAAWAMGLIAGYDPGKGSVRLPLVGLEVQVGEAGEGGPARRDAGGDAPAQGERHEAHEEDDD